MAAKNFSELKFDKRMKDWNIKQGFVTEREYQNHLKSLDDSADNSTLFSIEPQPGFEDNTSSDNQEDTKHVEESVDPQ